jgi:hypothetical protein
MSSEQLTHEKIVEIITIIELDRNLILRDISTNGDELGRKDNKMRSLEGLSRMLLSYDRIRDLPTSIPAPPPEPEPVPEPEPEPEPVV